MLKKSFFFQTPNVVFSVPSAKPAHVFQEIQTASLFSTKITVFSLNESKLTLSPSLFTDVFPGLITWLCTWSDISKADGDRRERIRETNENEEENRCAPPRREHSQQTFGAREGSGRKRQQEEHVRQRGQTLLDSESLKTFSSVISQCLTEC